MINKYSDSDKDIHKRIKNFVIKCFINIVRQIPKTPENIPIIKQISASLTSMGANDREADAAESNRDFISKYTIVKKETNETEYWLTVIRDTSILPSIVVDPYIKEANEIFRIISKIILNSKKTYLKFIHSFCYFLIHLFSYSLISLLSYLPLAF